MGSENAFAAAIEPAGQVQRIMLTSSPGVWDLAVRRADMIGRLATGATVEHVAVDAVVSELGRRGGRCTRCWRPGAGLIPGRSSGGLGQRGRRRPATGAGPRQVDETAPFRMVEQMREITDTAAATTRRARRDTQRRAAAPHYVCAAAEPEETEAD
jgi:hypothetical protein